MSSPVSRHPHPPSTGERPALSPDERSTMLGEVEVHGWALQYVMAPDVERSYAYTAGLFLRELPELVVRGLRPDQAWDVLNDVAGRATAGLPVYDGAVVPDVPTAGLALLRALADVRHLDRAHALARRRVDALEIAPAPLG